MNRSDILDGAKAGCIALVGVAVGTFVLTLVLPFGFLSRQLGLLGLTHVLVYDAHNPLAALGLLGSSLFTVSGTPLAVLVLLLPVVVLALQGRDLAQGSGGSLDGPARGALLAVGYTPLALLGAVFVLDSTGALDVLLTAVVYPVAFGALGGATA